MHQFCLGLISKLQTPVQMKPELFQGQNVHAEWLHMRYDQHTKQSFLLMFWQGKNMYYYIPIYETLCTVSMGESKIIIQALLLNLRRLYALLKSPANLRYDLDLIPKSNSSSSQSPAILVILCLSVPMLVQALSHSKSCYGEGQGKLSCFFFVSIN